MKIIALINQKGGVAKTTTAINLSAGMADKGYKVLIVDTDPQASATFALGIIEDDRGTLVDVYSAKKVKDVKLPIYTYSEKIDVIPANLTLSVTCLNLMSRVGSDNVLKTALASVADVYDFIIIDCPPSINKLTINALTAATDLIIPVETEAMSINGLREMEEYIEQVKCNTNELLNLLGILITKYDKRKSSTQQIQEYLISNYQGVVLKSVIRDNVDVADSVIYKKPVLEYKPQSNGAQDYLSLTNEILTKLGYEQK